MRHYLLLLAFILAPSAWASTITVTSTADSGTGSLRAALAAAASGDTIVFNVGSNQTITLASTLIIATNATIDGAGSPGLIISGNNAVQVFQVSSGVTAVLAHLTLADGNMPGGNGGGIENSGNLTVTACTLIGNTASFGGAIYNSNQLSVVNSTFSGNTAAGYGGGIQNDGALTVNNSTFVGNVASGSNGGGGGIYEDKFVSASSQVVNSLFQGNTALNGLGGSIEDFSHVIAADHNLYWNNADQSGAQGVNCNNCSSNTNAVTADPLLGSLANNGGPTQDYQPGLFGAAIEAGLDSACPATDQRGISRPQYAHCNIGSVETSWQVVTSTSDDINNSGSLRYALTRFVPGVGISFNLGTNQTITLASALTIANSIVIDGEGSPGLIISGNHAVQVFQVSSGVTAVLAHLTVANGNSPGGFGGGINNSGNLTVTACTLTGNAASTASGGAIYNASAQLSVVNSSFSGNTAAFGGGIDNVGTLTVNNSTFVGNVATGNSLAGGGIANVSNSSSASIANSLFQGNTALNGLSGSIADFGHTVVADHNLYWNNADQSGAQGVNCYGCSSNTNVVTADPLLGSLKNNGGPTQTYAPTKDTGAGIDAGLDSVCPATDQRGVPRPLGAHCDIGSVESDVIFTNGFE